MTHDSIIGPVDDLRPVWLKPKYRQYFIRGVFSIPRRLTGAPRAAGRNSA